MLRIKNIHWMFFILRILFLGRLKIISLDFFQGSMLYFPWKYALALLGNMPPSRWIGEAKTSFHSVGHCVPTCFANISSNSMFAQQPQPTSAQSVVRKWLNSQFVVCSTFPNHHRADLEIAQS